MTAEQDIRLLRLLTLVILGIIMGGVIGYAIPKQANPEPIKSVTRQEFDNLEKIVTRNRLDLNIVVPIVSHRHEVIRNN